MNKISKCGSELIMLANDSESIEHEIQPVHLVPIDSQVVMDQVQIFSCPHPFRTERVDYAVQSGFTLEEMVHAVQPDPVLLMHAHVYLDDAYIPRNEWHLVYPEPGARVTVRVVPMGGGGGGKSPLRTILTIAVIAASFAFAPGLGHALAQFATGIGPVTAGALNLGTAIAGGLISVVGNLIVNAIAPPRAPRLGGLSGGQSTQDSPTLSVTGARNQGNPFGVIPRPLGKHRMAPPYGASPFTEIEGDDQYLRLLFVWGYGPLEITDLKIGETPIDQFDDFDIETRQGYASDEPLTLYTNDVFEEALQITLKQVDSWQQRTTQLDADEISVDITFPQGLVKFGGGGAKQDQTVVVEVEYRSTVGPGAWMSAGSFNVTARKTSAIRKGLRWSVTQGQYDVRLRRVTTDTEDSQILDTVLWTTMRTITNIDPVNLAGLAKTAVRIKATDQLNGVVDTLNGIVQSILPDWNGSAWVEQATSNPASLFREVLQGSANARPLGDERIDLEGLQDWHGKNATAGREFNQVIDFQSSVRDTIADIAATGRASPTIKDGKWSVVIDEPKTVPVQHFTPRNSSDFSGEKVFGDLPHGWRVRFVNRDKNWKQDERIVYDDGFSQANATKFEGLELAGVTDPSQVWKDGRYHIATARLRPEMYSFTTDIEHIVCTRGDLVRLTHDVPLFGISAARVKSVQVDGGGNTTGVTLDETLAMLDTKSYSLRFRKQSGATLLKTLATFNGETDTVTFSTPIPPGETVGQRTDTVSQWPLMSGIGDVVPEVDDLAMFGETGSESVELLVKSIEPGPDLTAKLICIDAAPAVHTSDTGTIPTFDSQITPPLSITQPVVTSTRSDANVVLINPDGTPEVRILVSLGLIHLLPLDKLESLEARFRETGSEGPWSWLSPLSKDAREVSFFGVEEGETYDLNFRYRYKNGDLSAWTEVLGHQVTGIINSPRNEKILGWPGTLVDCFVGPQGNLLAQGSGTISSLTGTIDAQASTIETMTASKSPISYTTPEIDLSGDVTVTTRASVIANGTSTITMQTGTEVDGQATGSFVALGTVTARYFKLKISVSGTRPRVTEMFTNLEAITKEENYESINIATENGAFFERIAAGHFKIETKGGLSAIAISRIDAFIGSGGGFTYEVVSKNTTLTGRSVLAAEFKVYDSTNTLADATVDISLIGARS